MTKKTNLFPQPPKSSLELEVLRIIQSALKDRETELSVDEIKYIVKEMLPDIDALIANKVRKHFLEIGNFLVDKFKIKE